MKKENVKIGEIYFYTGYAVSLKGSVEFCTEEFTALRKEKVQIDAMDERLQGVVYFKYNGADHAGFTQNLIKIKKIKKKPKLTETERQILKYCDNNIKQMWASLIASIILGCDFRDAEQKIYEAMK